MNINRYNYEEYFILYMDNELGSEDRSQVEEFVAQNSDLKEELELLLQSKFTPDTNIVFAGKEDLIKEPGFSFVTLTNYEEWLVQYMDNELTPAQRYEVEQFMAAHPYVQDEFKLFQQTQLQPETIVFPDKESLYRKTERVPVVSINWRRIAIAAIFLLLVGGTTTVILLNNKKTGAGKGIAGTKGSTDNSRQSAAGNQQSTAPVNDGNNSLANATGDKKKDQQQQSPAIANVNTLVNNNKNNQSVKENREDLVKQDASQKINPGNKQESVINNNTSLIAENNTSNQKASNNLPDATNNPNVNAPDLGTVSRPDRIDSKQANLLNASTSNNNVTKNIDESSNLKYAVERSSLDQSTDLDQPTSKKGKLRGFLRKVTRTFEKKTNINTTDDDDRLLVGGLAIKLK